jgi:hypothetical protein
MVYGSSIDMLAMLFHVFLRLGRYKLDATFSVTLLAYVIGVSRDQRVPSQSASLPRVISTNLHFSVHTRPRHIHHLSRTRRRL